MTLNRKQLGAEGEERASLYLQEQGYIILQRNWRCSSGELDIIASKDNQLVFVEVRTRTVYAQGSGVNRYGSVLEAITPRKQIQLRRLAEIYLYQAKLRNISLRFDVVLVERSGEQYSMNHIKHAF
ncbi:YraN family protein [Paenibacillus endoradicis]|uniref:YraN family protein n=1 Tax=Paenibacillus endoradicis TaxID=2972487 RepID=UPI002159B22A|nr:YraN family protein [Paenibacillus endoradicis]MCR8656226.1 YraN family protein [Paenibacillus endoradicis]